MFYISCFEPHKSMIPHLHCLFFVEQQLIDEIKTIFDRNIEYYGLGRSDFISLNINENKNNSRLAASYVFKYMFKNLNKNNQTYSRMLDGYYKKNKIRAFRMSNIKIFKDINLTLDIYRKIYHNLDREYKNNLVKELNGKKSLFGYISNNITILKRIFDKQENCISSNDEYFDENKEFQVYIDVKKYKDIFTNKNITKVISFKVVHIINNEQIILYEKNRGYINNFDFFLKEAS